MDKNVKYLRVTIHDNDFTSSLEMVGELLYNIFQFEEKYPTENDFPMLKKAIQHLFFGADMVKDLMRWGESISNNKYEFVMNYFGPNLEFVDYLDIPDWDNRESIYIPMFDGAEVLMR